MNNHVILERNWESLLAQTVILAELSECVEQKGGRQRWLQNAKDKLHEVYDLVDVLKRRLTENGNSMDRHQLNMEILNHLKELSDLIDIDNSSTETILLYELASEKRTRYSFPQLVSITSNFATRIGVGALGDVYSGQLANGVRVAVKVLEDGPRIEEFFLTEVRIMGNTFHQNIVKLYGFCLEGDTKALLYEYMDNGSLDLILYEENFNIEWDKLYAIATKVAKALAYLDEGCKDQIIHFDIKAANVLLDSFLSPKLTGFGLANLKNQEMSHLKTLTGKGTPGYAAPEIRPSSVSLVTSKVDVYSFGMLMFELLGRRPNGDGNHWFPEIVWKKFEENKLDDLMMGVGIGKKDRRKATILLMVALWCGQHASETRPTMSTVAEILEMEVLVNKPPYPFSPADPSPRMQPDMNCLNFSSFTYSEIPSSTYSEVPSFRVDFPQTLERSEEQKSFQAAYTSFYATESLLRDLSLEKQNRYSYNELKKISGEFSTKIGSGTFGEVFKGELSNGVKVAIKVLKKNDYLEQTFLAEIRTMGNTYHENLVKLIGFCSERRTRALVYEYVAKGSLDVILYKKPLSIEWEKLYDIAVQVAKALAFLHHGCEPQIIHFDVKAANVLLDSDHSPKLTDFGLASLMNMKGTHLTMSNVKGTRGYGAPEIWSPFSHVTFKCDVYSFGMLLFEILGTAYNNQTSKWFPKYVWEKFMEGKLNDVIVGLGIKEKDRRKAKVLSTVALWCAQFTPQARPSMSSVVTVLEKIIPVNRPPNPFLPSNSFVSMQPEQGCTTKPPELI